MKRSWQTIVATAAFFMAAGTVQAAPTWAVISGIGSLAFSGEALEVIEASGAYILPSGAGNKANYDASTGNLALAFTSGTTVGEHIQTLTSLGSSLVIERTNVKNGRIILDRTITLSDFVFDLGNKTLSAGVKGSNLLTGTSTDYGFSVIFSAEDLDGGNIDPDAVQSGVLTGSAASHTMGALSIDPDTADHYLQTLQLPPFGSLTYLVKNANWGVVTANSVVQAVPEPSAYLNALAGIAILGVARLSAKKRVA